jgi:sRNA-binding protein
MTTKILAVVALAMLVSACESTSQETQPSASPVAQPTTTVAPSPSPSAAATAAASLKAGDKVKIISNGSAVEATVVSIDDQAGKATVRVPGETKERTVNLSDIVKQ